MALLQLLIVDDNPVERVMLRRAAEALERFDVIVAEDGAHALAACVQRVPDIVLTDVEMPVMDGQAFISALRKLPGADRVVVAVLTHHGDEATVIECLGAGADEYMLKPLPMQLVQARLNALCRMAELQRGLRDALAELQALGAKRIAEQRTRLASFLAYGVTHEMSSPLQALAANLAYLRDTIAVGNEDIDGALSDCDALIGRLTHAAKRLNAFQRVKGSTEPTCLLLKSLLQTVDLGVEVYCDDEAEAVFDPTHLKRGLEAIISALRERGGKDLTLIADSSAIVVKASFDQVPDASVMNSLLTGGFDDRHMAQTQAEFGLVIAHDLLRQNHATLSFQRLDDANLGALVAFDRHDRAIVRAMSTEAAS